MKRLLPLALLLAGCATTPEPASAPETKPAATASTTPPPAIPSDINPNRAFQLKDLDKVDIDLKGNKVHLWVMDTPNKQGEGMMFLKDGDVKADEGMLFAFYQVQAKVRPETGEKSGFWMHNTLIPLDIIYFAPSGKIVNIVHGKVEDDTSLPANADYQNVIELKAGTAARFGLKVGDKVTIPSLGKPPTP
jgi:uncharacterized membrane protein (UPF0127 family)